MAANLVSEIGIILKAVPTMLLHRPSMHSIQETLVGDTIIT